MYMYTLMIKDTSKLLNYYCYYVYPRASLINNKAIESNESTSLLYVMNCCCVGGGAQVLVQYDGECCRLPPVDPVGWEGAVCATNGRTYHDTAVISLMRKFGQCKYPTLIYDFYMIVTASLSYSSVVITRILETLQIIY